MILSWLGLIIGLAGIIGGQLLEGGHMSALMQHTAAFIVFGGTLGATMLASTVQEFTGALRASKKVFLGRDPDFQPLIAEIVQMASVARREGILALERMIPDLKNPFFSNNLRHVIDGYDATVLKEMMEDRISREEDTKTGIAKVYETAGGFSPTIGIIGAVLGLIHVMGNLADASKLGSGIAVAFVATVYGVGAANLFLLPMASKLKKIHHHEILEMEIIASGVMGIQNGLNPRVIEDRLHNLLGEHGASPTKGGVEETAEKKAA